MTREMGLGESFIQGLMRQIVTPVAAQAVANVTSSAPVQQALIQAQDAARKAEILAWTFGGMFALTFVFYIVPRMESPIPRVWRRSR